MNERTKFQGVRDVVRFNWPTYLKTIAAAAALLSSRRKPAQLVGCGFVGGAIGSVAATHVAYDRSGVYDLDWLMTHLGPDNVLVLHAGIDEASATLRDRHRLTRVMAIDFFAHAADSEPSIVRARGATLRAEDVGRPSEAAPTGHSFDVALAFLSAHELRSSAARQELFASKAALLKPGGRLVVVEHPRNLANVAAFGWGAWHFFSEAQWLVDIAGAGYRYEETRKISPFIRAYIAVAAEPRST